MYYRHWDLPFPITNPHLFPGTGYSTEFIPGMFAGGPLGGGPPRCLDCVNIIQNKDALIKKPSPAVVS